jgi:hypothetical protein
VEWATILILIHIFLIRAFVVGSHCGLEFTKLCMGLPNYQRDWVQEVLRIPPTAACRVANWSALDSRH